MSEDNLKVADRKAWVFLTQIHKDITEKQVEDYLSKICDAKCEKLELKSSERMASFRLCVPYEVKDQVMDGKLWPKGALVNRYYFPRRDNKAFFDKKADLENFPNMTSINNSG